MPARFLAATTMAACLLPYSGPATEKELVVTGTYVHEPSTLRGRAARRAHESRSIRARIGEGLGARARHAPTRLPPGRALLRRELRAPVWSRGLLPACLRRCTVANQVAFHVSPDTRHGGVSTPEGPSHGGQLPGASHTLKPGPLGVSQTQPCSVVPSGGDEGDTMDRAGRAGDRGPSHRGGGGHVPFDPGGARRRGLREHRARATHARMGVLVHLLRAAGD